MKSFLCQLSPAVSKFEQLQGKPDQTIICNSGYGPIFGGGHDLVISSSANTNENSYSKLGYTYRSPTNSSGDSVSLAGTCNFKLLEYEMYRVVPL